jgi:acetyl esterase/lipase
MVAVLQAIREASERYAQVDAPEPVTGVTFTPASAQGVPVEWVAAPGADASQRIVMLHGGAWIAGSVQTYRSIAAEFTKKTGRAVLLVNYALAPERPFPAGLLDCCTALAWAAEHGPNGAAPAQSLALVGDSAGANLAAAACLQAMGNALRLPDCVVLMSPSLDTTPEAPRTASSDPVCDAAGMATVMAMYVQDGTPLTDPRISPLHAGDAALRRFPPTLVQVSGAEFQYPDALAFAQRLASAGRRVNLSVWPDMPHVWHGFMPLLPEAELAIDEAVAFVTQNAP